MSRPVLFWLAVLFLVAGGTFLTLALRGDRETQVGSQTVVDTEYLNSPEYKSSDWLQEFTLTERSGKKIDSKDLLGKPYIASFFYTSCPTECLQQNQKLSELAREFRDTDFVFLSISCDPETDSPSRLREYANRFKADDKKWLFLTGDLTYLRKVASEMYRVPLDKQAHTERFIAVDRVGVMRKQFGWKQPAQMTELRKLMHELLEEDLPAPVAQVDPDQSVPADEQASPDSDTAPAPAVVAADDSPSAENPKEE